MTTPTTLGHCSEQVSDRNGWNRYACGKKAVVIVDGKPRCTIHNPAYIAKKRAAAELRYKAHWAEREAARDTEAEMRRRADCYPELLEAARFTLDVLHRVNSPTNPFGLSDPDMHIAAIQLQEAIRKASPQAQ